jgi:hypothetical protein
LKWKYAWRYKVRLFGVVFSCIIPWKPPGAQGAGHAALSMIFEGHSRRTADGALHYVKLIGSIPGGWTGLDSEQRRIRRASGPIHPGVVAQKASQGILPRYGAWIHCEYR